MKLEATGPPLRKPPLERQTAASEPVNDSPYGRQSLLAPKKKYKTIAPKRKVKPVRPVRRIPKKKPVVYASEPVNRVNDSPYGRQRLLEAYDETDADETEYEYEDIDTKEEPETEYEEEPETEYEYE